MSTSEVITNVILAIIILVTYWFQRKKIDSLETSINSHKDVISAQKEIIDAMKKAHEIIDPEKYKEHIDFIEKVKQKKSNVFARRLKMNLGENYRMPKRKA